MLLKQFSYAAVFAAIEQQVISLGSECLPGEQVTTQLDQFKGFATRSISDTEDISTLVFVAFYPGVKAATVISKRPVIDRHCPNWQVVAKYGESHIRRILDDPNMIGHERKVRAFMRASLQ